MDSSIWPIDGTLTGMATLGQSGPEGNGNEGALHTSQIFRSQVKPSDVI